MTGNPLRLANVWTHGGRGGGNQSCHCVAMDPRLRGDDDFFSVSFRASTRNPGLYKENVVQSTTLIIIPILNGEIASSLPSSGIHAPAETTVVTNQPPTIRGTRIGITTFVIMTAMKPCGTCGS